MNIEFATLDTCAEATGTVVVIDVCRAFTTAAYAFGSHVKRIFLAGTMDEALALRNRFPGSLVMGEVNGLPVKEFDFWNSPIQLSMAEIHGKTLIQRTSAGTQGIVRSVKADHLFAASFAVSGATVRAIQRSKSQSVTFVITGGSPEDPRLGLEDRACAEYMAALLRGENPDWRVYMDWEDDFRAAHQLDSWPEPLRSQFDADLALCRFVDRFIWAMPVRRESDLLMMEKEVQW